jgi:hypothetical protein
MSCTENCYQGRNCTCKPTAQRQRTCAELGVCQGRTPACPGCSFDGTATHDTSALPPGGFWIAPGVIDFEPPPEPWSWLEISLLAIGGSGLLGFVAGVATMWWKGLL